MQPQSSVHRPTEIEESSADTHPHACSGGLENFVYAYTCSRLTG